MKKSIGRLFFGAIIAFFVESGTLFADSPMISIDLGAGEALEPGDLAGFVPATNWNHTFGWPDVADTPLNFSDGTASGATLSADFSSNKTSPVGVDPDPNTEMFNRGGAVMSGGGSVITVSNLPNTGDWENGYNVYVYFSIMDGTFPVSNYQLNLTLGDTTYYTALPIETDNYAGAFAQTETTDFPRDTDKNFAKFTGVSGSSFTLIASSDVADRILITGMQIEPIPQPERAVISIDLGSADAVSPNQTAGVYPVANWVQAAGFPDVSNAALNFSDGTAADATISADFTYNKTTTISISSDPNTAMYTRGGGVLNGAGSDITVTGLPSTPEWSGGYDVYVYFAPSDGYANTNTLDLTIGGTTYYTSLSIDSTNYTGSFEQAVSTDSAARDSGKNYAKFTGVTGTSFTLNALCNVEDRIAITGMQLVSDLFAFDGPISAPVLSISAATDGIIITATNITPEVTTTLKAGTALSSTNWLTVGGAVAGVSETNWVVAATNAMFFKVESE